MNNSTKYVSITVIILIAILICSCKLPFHSDKKFTNGDSVLVVIDGFPKYPGVKPNYSRVTNIGITAKFEDTTCKKLFSKMEFDLSDTSKDHVVQAYGMIPKTCLSNIKLDSATTQIDLYYSNVSVEIYSSQDTSNAILSQRISRIHNKSTRTDYLDPNAGLDNIPVIANTIR